MNCYVLLFILKQIIFLFIFQVSYYYKIKLEKQSGGPVNSKCECPAGKGPHATCKHIAAVLLMAQCFSEKGDILVEKTCTQGLQTFHQPRSYYRGTFLYINLNYINFHTTGRGPWCGSSFGKQFLVLGHINLIFSSLNCKFPKMFASKWNACNELFWIDMPVPSQDHYCDFKFYQVLPFDIMDYPLLNFTLFVL